MSIFKQYPLAVMLSVIFHALLVAVFVFGVDFNDPVIHAAPAVNVVKATVIDGAKIKAEADRIKALEHRKVLREKQRLADIKKKRQADEKKNADLKKKKEDLKKKKEREKKKLAKQKSAEAAKLAKLKKQQAIAKKKKADEKKKRAAAKKKKAELAKKKKLAAAKKEKARKIKEKQRLVKEQADREQALRQELAVEEENERVDAEVKRLTVLIRNKVERNWIQPPGDISGLFCVVRVSLIPGGDVNNAQVIQSSGNAFFDRSVELATRKAAPLPWPSDPSMFNYFRTLEFYFRPGG